MIILFRCVGAERTGFFYCDRQSITKDSDARILVLSERPHTSTKDDLGQHRANLVVHIQKKFNINNAYYFIIHCLLASKILKLGKQNKINIFLNFVKYPFFCLNYLYVLENSVRKSTR